MKKRTVGWPHFGKDEIAAVTRVLRSGKVNQWTGREVFSFEEEYARYLGVPYAVALANGSVALDLGLRALGIGPGDEVIVPSRSFVASASCVALSGALPVFCDVDPESQDLTVETAQKCLSKRTKALIAVHVAGWPCDLRSLRGFCDRARIHLIEDCAQAHGARYRGRPVGFAGDAACFSFCQDKIITTGGEGGLLATGDRSIWRKAWSFKDHGRDHATMFRRHNSYNFVWAVHDFGSNYRMTEMQAALGRSMLKKLDSWVRTRRLLAAILTRGLGSFGALRVTIPPPEVYHSYYKYYCFVRPGALRAGWSRDRIVRALNEQGVVCGTGVCPEIYREKAFTRYQPRGKSRRWPVARELGETSVMLQVHPTLREDDAHRTVEAMRKVLRVGAR